MARNRHGGGGAAPGRGKRRDPAETRLRVLRLALEGTPASRIPKLTGIPRRTVWNHLTVGERSGILQRVGKTGSPAMFQAGPNASALLTGKPLVGPAAVPVPEPGSKPFSRARVHSIIFAVDLVGRPRPSEQDLPWKPQKSWGRCRSWGCKLSLGEVGEVGLRRMGEKRLMVYAPFFFAKGEELQKLLDTLWLKVNAVLVHLTRTFGYRFGAIRLAGKPHFGFPIDHPGVKNLLAYWKPVIKEGKLWADTSPDSGGAEIETDSLELAKKVLQIPDRVDNLERIAERHSAELREARSELKGHGEILDRVVRLLETQQRHIGELAELVRDQSARTTFTIQELAKRLEQRQKGWTEN